MPPTRRKSTSRRRGNALRGPVAILFLVVVVAIYLFQQYQEGSFQLPENIPVPDLQITVPVQGQPQAGEPSSGSGAGQAGAIQAWFTNPLRPDDPGPELQLVQAIVSAQKTIDMAIYNLTLEDVSDALLAAYERGVVVRLVMESESMEKEVPRRLADAGIPIVGDNREGLMHNKFVVIDSQEVWSGSTNLAYSAAHNDFNNLVRLRSQRMAQNYSVEFNEMFVEGLFGPSGRDNTPYPKVNIDGVPVEVYFSPDDGVADQVVSAIRQAKTSIHFMVYSFTSDDIAQAILDRAGAGVEVRGVFDESQRESNRGTEFEPLQAQGLDVRLDGIGGLLHHKVFIIDGQVVVTGSYNFSANAERSNDENLLIIRSPALAGQYEAEFEKVYSNGR